MHKYTSLVFILMAMAVRPALAEDITGTWSISGQVTPTCVFAQTDVSLIGSCSGPSASGPLSGTISGQSIQWTYTWTGRPQRTRGTFEFAGTVDGSRMSGTVLIDGKSQSFTAKRTSR
jgi:hypothetical protein